MRRALIALLLLIAPLTGFSAEASNLFAEAKKVAQTEPEKARKLFQLAALKFETLASEQPHLKANALYNGGNASFFAEEHGRALYAYRRAEQLRPFNSELKQNIAWLREMNGAISEPEPSIWQTICEALTLRIRILTVMVLWLAVMLLLAIKQWTGKSNRAVILSLSAFASIFGATVLMTIAAGPRHGIVLSHQVDARKGDGFIYETAFGEALTEATEFSVLQVKGEWVQIKLSDENEAWLPAAEVGLW